MRKYIVHVVNEDGTQKVKVEKEEKSMKKKVVIGAVIGSVVAAIGGVLYYIFGIKKNQEIDEDFEDFEDEDPDDEFDEDLDSESEDE